jgi:hypothetical protein
MDIIDCKKECQPRTNIVKDEKGDLVADSHSILARWRNHFSQLLNIHGEMKLGIQLDTAEPLVPEAYALKFDLAIEKLKSHESPGINQIPAEFLKAK